MGTSSVQQQLTDRSVAICALYDQVFTLEDGQQHDWRKLDVDMLAARLRAATDSGMQVRLHPQPDNFVRPELALSMRDLAGMQNVVTSHRRMRTTSGPLKEAFDAMDELHSKIAASEIALGTLVAENDPQLAAMDLGANRATKVARRPHAAASRAALRAAGAVVAYEQGRELGPDTAEKVAHAEAVGAAVERWYSHDQRASRNALEQRVVARRAPLGMDL